MTGISRVLRVVSTQLLIRDENSEVPALVAFEDGVSHRAFDCELGECHTP